MCLNAEHQQWEVTQARHENCTASRTQRLAEKAVIEDETEFRLPDSLLVNQVGITSCEGVVSTASPHNDSAVDPVNSNNGSPIFAEGFTIEQDKDLSLTFFLMR